MKLIRQDMIFENDAEIGQLGKLSIHDLSGFLSRKLRPHTADLGRRMAYGVANYSQIQNPQANNQPHSHSRQRNLDP